MDYVSFFKEYVVINETITRKTETIIILWMETIIVFGGNDNEIFMLNPSIMELVRYMKMISKEEEICNPLKEYDPELYDICVERGYELSRDALMSEIDNLEHAIYHDPEQALFEYRLSPREVKCLQDKGVYFDFNESEVYHVLEGAVQRTIEELEDGYVPEDFIDKITLLSESSFNDNLWNDTQEKIDEELKTCPMYYPYCQ